MEKKNNKIVRSYIPWYSDDYRISYYDEQRKKDYLSYTPQDIYAELVKNIVNQDEACRKVSVMMYQHLRGHRFVGMLAGPTGSGKSFIAENLKKIFPDMVYLRDISNVTNDGWSGGKKVHSLFQGVSYPGGDNVRFEPVIFLDECDKMFTPKHTSSGDNVSETVQSEFLSVIHGGEIEISTPDRARRMISTSGISFLFAGAFEKKAKEIAEKENGPALGFGMHREKVSAYDSGFNAADIIEAGCISELCGRIQRIISLNAIGEEDYRKMLDEPERGPVHELEAEFGIPIRISGERKDLLAHEAYASGLGIRGIKNRIRDHIDEIIWNDQNVKILNIA